MSQNNVDRRVGVIEIPDLVPVLSDAGYEVVTGDTVPDAVKAIQGAFTTGAFPIVVADSNTQGLDQWIMAVASMDGGPEVSVLTHGDEAINIVHDNVIAIRMPFTLSELAEEAALVEVAEDWEDVVWPEDDQETEVEPEQTIAPALPGLPAFGHDTSADSFQHQDETPGDTGAQEQQDDVWDATAAHRRRLAAQRQANHVQQDQQQPAEEQPVEPVMPQQPVDYRQQPDQDDVYDTGLDLGAAPESEPAPQPVAPEVDQPVRRPRRRAPAASSQPVAEPAPQTMQQQAPSMPQQPQASQTQASNGHGQQWYGQQEQPAMQQRQPTPPEYGQQGIRRARVRTRQSPMIILSGAKGGIGKTTFARQVALTAAAHGYRTVLIDGDLGQANVPKFLKMDTSSYNVPTISDFALGNATLEEIVITSDVIDQLRPDNATPVPDRLSVVLAPSDDIDVKSVTAQHYVQVVADVRERFDMVVFDGQIMKTTDEFMFTRSLIIPEVRDNGAFFLGLSDGSNSALKDLVDRIASMVEQGVDRRRILVAMNNIPPNRIATRSIDNQLNKIVHGRIGIYLGIVNADDQVWSRMMAGEPDLKNLQIDQVVYQALFRATGYEKFDQQFDTDIPESQGSAPKEKKPGFFARLLGRE